jgi:hypothetical protein
VTTNFSTDFDDPMDEFTKTASPEQEAPEEDEDIFGDIDILEVSDNPFDIDDGTYHCRCTSAKIERKDNGDRFLKVEWSIEEPESRFDGMKIRDNKKLPPRGVKFKELDAKAQKAVTFFKMRVRQAFDLSETQLSTFKPSDCVDKEAMVTTFHNQGSGDNSERSYVNVDKALAMRIYNERQAKNNSSAEVGKSVGL